MGVLFLLLIPPVATAHATGHALTNIEVLSKPVIVHVGNDEAVMTAVSTLQRFMPSARVVSVSSPTELEHLLLSNVAIFLVGHGTPGGLGTTPMDVVIPWTALNALQERHSGSKVYVVACDAGTYLQQAGVTLQRVSFAPTTKIDAELGALQALVQFARDFSLPPALILQVTLYLLAVMLTKPATSYQLLGPCLESCTNPPSGGGSSSSGSSGSGGSSDLLANLKGAERAYWAAHFIVGIAVTLMGGLLAYYNVGFLESLAASIGFAGIPYFLFDVALLAAGKIDIVTLILDQVFFIATGIYALLQALILIAQGQLWNWQVLSYLLGAAAWFFGTYLANVFTGGLAMVGYALMILGVILASLPGFMDDLNDPDDVVG